MIGILAAPQAGDLGMFCHTLKNQSDTTVETLNTTVAMANWVFQTFATIILTVMHGWPLVLKLVLRGPLISMVLKALG